MVSDEGTTYVQNGLSIKLRTIVYTMVQQLNFFFPFDLWTRPMDRRWGLVCKFCGRFRMPVFCVISFNTKHVIR